MHCEISFRTLGLFLVPFLGLLLCAQTMGCPPAPPYVSDDDDDDNDDASDDDVGDDDAGDDDVGDDDGGDDDMGDDDGGDDDGGDDDGGDDDTFPASPYGYRIEVALDATGGANGGVANVQYDHIMIDANYNDLCTVGFDFTATYDFGQNLGNDFWQSIDEVITWTGGGETSNNCPLKWAIYKGDPISWFMWGTHPMAFVSCSQVQNVPALASTQLGTDMIKGQFGDTFGAWCNDIGPAVEVTLGSGPIEGIWLLPGVEGALDSLGTFGYFAPPSQTNVDVWMLLGLLMADATNTNEPTAGLQGDYLTMPIWLWIYSP